MFRLTNQSGSCIVEAKSEHKKNEFLRMGFTLLENKTENNDKKVDDIKKTIPKRRKAVEKDEGQIKN